MYDHDSIAYGRREEELERLAGEACERIPELIRGKLPEWLDEIITEACHDAGCDDPSASAEADFQRIARAAVSAECSADWSTAADALYSAQCDLSGVAGIAGAGDSEALQGAVLALACKMEALRRIIAQHHEPRPTMLGNIVSTVMRVLTPSIEVTPAGKQALADHAAACRLEER